MAVVVSVADFRAQFPEFSDTADTDIERALVEAKLIHNVRKLATLYAAAHVLTYRLASISGSTGMGGGQSTVTGTVNTKRVGPLSISYGTHTNTSTTSNNTKSATDVAYFSSTAYGQHFLTLEQRTPRVAIGAIVAGKART